MADVKPSQDEPKPAEKIRAEAKEATRRALLEAGLAETIKAGGETPTVDAVVERAGYTRGAFYFYFEDRDHFVAEMLEWMLGQLETMTATTTDSDAGIAETLTAFAELVTAGGWLGLESDARSAYLAILRGLKPGSRLRKSHADVMNAATARFEVRVRTDQTEGRIRDDVDAHHVTRLLQVTAVGAVMWSDIGIDLDFGGLVETLLQLLAPGPAPA